MTTAFPQQEELDTLRQRVAQLEAAIATATPRIQQLRVVEHKLSLLVERNPMALIEWNAAFEVVDWNPVAEKIFGYSREEMLGRDTQILLPDSSKEEVRQVLQALIKQEGGERNINENLTKDGRKIVCEWYNTPLSDANGNLTGLISLVVDLTGRRKTEMSLKSTKQELEVQVQARTAELQAIVTQLEAEIQDRQRAEQQLQEQARFLQSIWDGVDYGIFVLEVLGQGDEFRFVRSNPAMNRMSPIPFDNLSGKTLAEALPSEYAHTFRQRYRECIAAGTTITVEESYSSEVGEENWRLLKLTPLHNRDSGIDQIVVTATDITARKRAEADLQRTQKFLESVLNSLPIAVAAKDAEELRYVLWNPAAEEVLGFSTAEVLGQTDYDFWSREEASFITSRDRAVLNNRQVLDIAEKLVHTGHGEPRLLHIKKAPILDAEGKPEYVLVITEDITERKQTEQSLLLYKHAVESSSDAISLATARGIHFYQNPAFSELYGYATPEALNEVGGIPMLFTNPSDWDEIVQAIARGNSWISEVNHQSRDEESLQVLVRSNVIKDEAGNVLGIIGTMTDISEAKRDEAVRQQTEAALQQKTSELQAIFQALPDLYFRMDWNGAILDFQAGSAANLYIPPEEFLGKQMPDYLPPEVGQQFAQAIAQVQQTQTLVSLEYELPIAEDKHSFEARILPLQNDQIIAIIRDISDRKQAEQELQRFATILEATTDMVGIADAEGNTVYLNKAGRRSLGLGETEDLSGIHCSTYNDPSVSDVFNQALGIAMQAGIWRGENLLLSRDGQQIPVSQVVVAHRSQDGELEFMSTIMRDISERKAAEAILQEQEQFLRSIYNGVRYSIFVVDVLENGDFQYRAYNSFAEETNGVVTSQIAGKTPEELFGFEEGYTIRQSFSRCVEVGMAVTTEECLTLNGEKCWMLTTFNPLRDRNGKIYQLVGTAFDISDRKHTEEQLRQREEFLRSIFDGAQQGIFVVDVTEAGAFHYVDHNPVIERISGVSSTEVQNKTPTEIFGIEAGTAFEQHYSRCVNTKTAISYEEFVSLRNGEPRWYITTLSPIQNSEGNIYRLIGTVLDITDRKYAEESLMLYKQAVDSSSDAIGMADANGIHFYQNSAFSQLFECATAEEFIEFGSIQAAVPNQAVVQEILRALLQGKSWIGEVENQSRNGKRFQSFLRADAIKDPSGKTLGLIAALTDITDRKRTEEALRQSEQRFRDVSDAAGEYIWEIDANGNYTFATDKAKLVKGYDSAELLGRSLFEFMPDEDSKTVQNILQLAFANKETFRLQHRSITPSGEVVWEEVNGVPMLDEAGEIVGFRGVGMSITERKLAELQLQQSEAQLRQQATNLEKTLRELQRTQSQLVQSEKMSSLGQLVAGVAHEINNPVNFIYGNLNHANEYTQDLLHLISLYQEHHPSPNSEIQAEIEAIDLEFLMEDLPKLLSSMKVGADRIQKIVASLRTFSRMDEAEFKAVDLHEGIDSTLMILQNRLKARHDRPEIQVIKDYGELPPVECYAGQLNQVFMNILSNALDALDERDAQRSLDTMQENPSSIHICTEMLASGQVVIRIADNGSGIPEEVQQRLFDPFFTTKPIGKGTGMGLSISYQIVTERHNGMLECRSTLEQGAEFVIQIPLRQNSQ